MTFEDARVLMDQQDNATTTHLVELTAGIVSAYLMHNAVQRTDIPAIIESIHGSLVSLGASKPAPEAERPVPAVPIKKSIQDDYILSLEDGRRYKSLKRHISGYGLTPDSYREKWGLPADYPMVAPSYARQRSELAKAMGLGLQRRKASEAPSSGAATEVRKRSAKAPA